MQFTWKKKMFQNCWCIFKTYFEKIYHILTKKNKTLKIRKQVAEFFLETLLQRRGTLLYGSGILPGLFWNVNIWPVYKKSYTLYSSGFQPFWSHKVGRSRNISWPLEIYIPGIEFYEYKIKIFILFPSKAWDHIKN